MSQNAPITWEPEKPIMYLDGEAWGIQKRYLATTEPHRVFNMVNVILGTEEEVRKRLANGERVV